MECSPFLLPTPPKIVCLASTLSISPTPDSRAAIANETSMQVPHDCHITSYSPTKEPSTLIFITPHLASPISALLHAANLDNLLQLEPIDTAPSHQFCLRNHLRWSLPPLNIKTYLLPYLPQHYRSQLQLLSLQISQNSHTILPTTYPLAQQIKTQTTIASHLPHKLTLPKWMSCRLWFS